MKTIIRYLLMFTILFYGGYTTPCDAQGVTKVLSKGWKAISKLGKSAGKGAKKVIPYTDDAFRAARKSKNSTTTTSNVCTACNGTGYPYTLNKCVFCTNGITTNGTSCSFCNGTGYVKSCPKCGKKYRKK